MKHEIWLQCILEVEALPWLLVIEAALSLSPALQQLQKQILLQAVKVGHAYVQPCRKCQALCAGNISLAKALEELSTGQDASAALAKRALEACSSVSGTHSADMAAASKCSLTGLPGSMCPDIPLVELSGCLFWVSLEAASKACVYRHAGRSTIVLFT